MDNVPRLRFAPSPTGIPHIGNLHTALFSWALARAMRGDFIIRIEDTDQARNTPRAAQQMLGALQWLGLDWDEGPDVGGDAGPYLQSERLPAHRRIAARLVAAGNAYYGDDPARPASSLGAPLRLRMPRDGETQFEDGIRGAISFTHTHRPVADPVLVRSDGRPLYHLAAMVDDHDMGITHVVRGEEWLSSTPVHVQLYRALGWAEPVWIHLPLILNQQGQKLSKRDPQGGTLITDFQAAGYLPAALFNYLLLLGWTPDGEQEIVDKWTVRQQFRLERLSPSPSIFDWDKLRWVNRHYLQRLRGEQVAEGIQPFLEDAYGDLPDKKWLLRLATVVRGELQTFEDAVALAGWAFEDGYAFTAAGTAALRTEPAKPVLLRLIAELAAIVLLDEQTAQAILSGVQRQFYASQGWRAGEVLHPIRAALTGDVIGPPLAAILSLLGKQRALQRLADAIRRA